MVEGAPVELTVWHCSGVGDRVSTGLNHLAHEGLIVRVIGGHWGMGPKMAALAERNLIEAYNLPQGSIAQLLRETGGGRPGLLTSVGLGTFVDPRLEGGKLNAVTREQIVDVVRIQGQEYLFHRAPRLDVALLRATSADEWGNLSFSEEAAFLEALPAAQAVKANGGVVLVQVKYLVQAGSLDPREVKVPGALVDAIAVVPDQPQTSVQYYQPAFTSIARIPAARLPVLPLGPRRVVAQRAIDELAPGAIVNLGVGMPDGIAKIAAERGLLDGFAFAVEHGHIGGIPAGGVEFGAVYNAVASLDSPAQFDFFDGGGLDVAFLGMAQVDRHGNVNASQFGRAIAGSGGFINISQGTRKVVFCGSFTVGARLAVTSDGLLIEAEGTAKKFVRDVQQVTFSAERARQLGQDVMYITERAVFRLVPEGIELIEIAPGLRLETDILDQMEFTPSIGEIQGMDLRHFQ